jgi:hypothetical protein
MSNPNVATSSESHRAPELRVCVDVTARCDHEVGHVMHVLPQCLEEAGVHGAADRIAAYHASTHTAPAFTELRR